MTDASAVIALYTVALLQFEWNNSLGEFLSATFYLCSFHMLSSLTFLLSDFSSVLRSQILGLLVLLLYIFFPSTETNFFFHH